MKRTIMLTPLLAGCGAENYTYLIDIGSGLVFTRK